MEIPEICCAVSQSQRSGETHAGDSDARALGAPAFRESQRSGPHRRSLMNSVSCPHDETPMMDSFGLDLRVLCRGLGWLGANAGAGGVCLCGKGCSVTPFILQFPWGQIFYKSIFASNSLFPVLKKGFTCLLLTCISCPLGEKSRGWL